MIVSSEWEPLERMTASTHSLNAELLRDREDKSPRHSNHVVVLLTIDSLFLFFTLHPLASIATWNFCLFVNLTTQVSFASSSNFVFYFMAKSLWNTVFMLTEKNKLTLTQHFMLNNCLVQLKENEIVQSALDVLKVEVETCWAVQGVFSSQLVDKINFF